MDRNVTMPQPHITHELKYEDLDLSYSGIVSLIQNDNAKADELVHAVLLSIVEREKAIQGTELILNRLKADTIADRAAIEKVCKHRNLIPPLNYVFDGQIYAVNERFEVSVFKITNHE